MGSKQSDKNDEESYLEYIRSDDFDDNVLYCIHCDNKLTGKQVKYCCERCKVRERSKRQKKKWNKIKNDRRVRNKIAKKIKREELKKERNKQDDKVA